MEGVKRRGLSASGLKWIALGLMVLDHVHYMFAYTGRVPEWFSMLGRLSAPLFLFCLVEGFTHTRNRRNYFIKVYAIHLLMSGLLFLMIAGLLPVRPDGFYPMNGMMTSFSILMIVFQGMDWLAERRWGPGLAAAEGPAALTLALERLGYEVADRPVPGAVLFRADREGLSLTVEQGGLTFRPVGEDALEAAASYVDEPQAVPAFRPDGGGTEQK